jgi:hypothetical protein
MNDNTKKYLKCGGILCAIGAVGALLITGTNALTASTIAKNNKEKEAAAYQAIYATTASVSDSVAVSGKYVSSYVIAKDSSDVVLGNIYTGTASYGQTVNMKIMVGISGTKAKPVLGKVSILNNGATGGFDTTVVSNYVDPYNANPSDTTLGAVKCGATAAATSIKLIVNEATDLYKTGGAVEDIEGEIKSIFDTEAAYDDPVDVSGTNVTKYYAVYSDAAKANYLGTVYRMEGTTSDNSSLTLMVGFSGAIASPLYGKLAVVDSTADIAQDVANYNAAPGADKLTNWSAATSGALAATMVEEAKGLYVKGTGNLSLEGLSLSIYPALAALSDVTSLTSSTLTRYWIAYSDTAKTSELGYIFDGKASVTWKNEADEDDTIAIRLIVGISGTSSSPVLGKLKIIAEENTKYDDAPYIDAYNTAPSDTTLANVKCGATYSANLIKTVVTAAKNQFVTLKGGN